LSSEKPSRSYAEWIGTSFASYRVKHVLIILKAMKRFLITPILAAMIAVGTAAGSQEPDEYLGLPGDNFNLYAAMKLFQESETLEGFERSLNDEETRINNLDLNNDNYIDYIKVIDYVDGDIHNIVLQAVINRDESQDVAVFSVEKFRDGSVQIQLTGDEALYGRNYIIEPIYDETPNPGYTGGVARERVTVVRTTYVEVAAWPVIRFIYLPTYRVWRSSWYWGYYPAYWSPWRPYYWHYYYGYHYNYFPHYYGYYRRWDNHRISYYNNVYYNNIRVYSVNVTNNINKGVYRTTYSRPEQRQEGEALYARTNPGRTTRQSVSTSSQTDNRRATVRSSTTSGQAGTRTSTSSGTATRRSTQSSTGTAGTTRQSTSTATRRSSTGSPASESGTTTRSSSSTGSRSQTGTATRSQGTTTRQSSSTVNQGSRTGSATRSEGTGTRQSTSSDSQRSRSNTATIGSGSSSRQSSQASTSVSRRSSSPASTGGQRATSSSSSRQSAGTSSSQRNRSSSSSSSSGNRSKSADSESKSSRRN
jgi:hypothetical protein